MTNVCTRTSKIALICATTGVLALGACTELDLAASQNLFSDSTPEAAPTPVATTPTAPAPQPQKRVKRVNPLESTDDDSPSTGGGGGGGGGGTTWTG